MATTTVTHPAEFPQPKQILRQGIVVAILMVIGVGLGMLLDTGRTGGPVEAAGLTQGQQAAANRASAQAASLGNSRPITATPPGVSGQAASDRAFDLPAPLGNSLAGPTAWRGESAVPQSELVPEHGPFTPMVNRGTVDVEGRFAGQDGNFDPDLPAQGLTGPS